MVKFSLLPQVASCTQAVLEVAWQHLTVGGPGIRFSGLGFHWASLLCLTVIALYRVTCPSKK